MRCKYVGRGFDLDVEIKPSDKDVLIVEITVKSLTYDPDKNLSAEAPIIDDEIHEWRKEDA